MVVKVGTEISEPVRITGGAVQGSVLGILDHNAVLESLDDNLLDVHVTEHVDDITMVEPIPKNKRVEEDLTGSKPIHVFQPEKSQVALDTVARRAQKKACKLIRIKRKF